MRLSLTHKFVFVAVAYTIPIGALLTLYVREQTKAITFAESELIGNEAIAPLRDAMVALSRHRFTDHGADFEAAFAKFSKSLARHEELLQFTKEGLEKRKREHLTISTLNQEWEAFKKAEATLAPDQRDQQLTHLISDVRGIIGHAGDTSNLVLDPDLDSYYLMDATVFGLPQLVDRIQDSANFARRTFTTDAKPSLKDTVRLNVLAAQLRSDIDRIAESTQTAINEDTAFYGIDPDLAEKTPALLKDFVAATEKFLSATTEVETKHTSTEYVALADATIATAGSFWASQSATLEQMLSTRIASFTADRRGSLSIFALCWLVAGTLALFLTRSVTNPIKKILDHLHSVFEGNVSTSQTLLETSHKASAAATEQAASIQETVTSMAEMTSMLAQTAQHAEGASQLAGQVTAQTDAGRTTMSNMAGSMADIAAANVRLREITRIIDDVSTKTNIINDIVFKTQLLSVNASIEAARAGQQGKGFAVVANEVADLAALSGKAAGDIRDLLNESKTQVADIVGSTDESVRSGQNVCDDALKTFEQISTSVNSISTKIHAIHEATREQELGVKQTSIAMRQMNETTAINSSFARENASLSEALKQNSQRLSRIGRAMNLVVLGSESSEKKSPEAKRSVIGKILQVGGADGVVDASETASSAPQPDGAEVAQDTKSSNEELLSRIVRRAQVTQLGDKRQLEDGDEVRRSA